MVKWEFMQSIINPDAIPVLEYLNSMGNIGWHCVQIDVLSDPDGVAITMQRPTSFEMTMVSSDN